MGKAQHNVPKANGGADLDELKRDGNRIKTHLQDGRVTLYTR